MPYIGDFVRQRQIATDITDGAITTAKLADDAVTTAKIADDAIVAAAIADNAVVTAAINADAVTSAKIPANQIGNSELDLTAAYAFTGAVTGATLTPAFHAYLYSTVAFSNQTVTVIPMAHERFDTDSAYNTSTYKFTPQVAGTYMFGVGANMQMGDGKYFYVYVIKNSQVNAAASILRVTQTFGSEDYAGATATGPIVMNGSSDYVSPAVYHNHGSDRDMHNHYDAIYFWGFRLY